MSTAKQLMHEGYGYFEELKESTQEIVKDAILKIAQERRGPDCWKSDDDALESIECKGRSGFIPHSWNKGGFQYNNFTDLMAYWGGGYSCKHPAAKIEIERQIDYGLDSAIENFRANNDLKLNDLGVTKEQTNYHDLYELGHGELAEELSSYENENLSGESSIMHTLRFMYHGKDDKGLHAASVSAAINTEGPYHRSHISWAPNVFCEGASEVEITWRNNAELKRKLEAAFKKVHKAVF